MKKLIVVALALVMVATPTWAAITVSCAQVPDTNQVEVTYAGPNEVRAFALNIAVSAGTIGSLDCVSTDYDTYPGSIVIIDGVVTNPGTCICDAGQYAGTELGIGTGSVTIEMGSLYVGEPNKPATSGVLCRFTVDTDCTVTITENAIRGGVVLKDPDVPSGVPTPVTTCAYVEPSGECFPDTFATYTDWLSMGQPNCWCGTAGDPQWPYQCDGDTDNDTQTYSNYRIYTNDFNAIIANWKKLASDSTINPCADIDHDAQTYSNYRVYTNDFNTVIGNWKKQDSTLGADCPRTQ